MFAWACLAVGGNCTNEAASRNTVIPTADSAKCNAFHIFNAVHAVTRLWGSAVHHNGFGLIPSVVPVGTLLHHGSGQEEPPKGPEWLAFEADHAENFAKRMEKMVRKPLDNGEQTRRRAQKPLASRLETDCSNKSDDNCPHGYLHTYQAKRDLNLLILDGMSAASADSEGAGAGAGDLFAMLLLDTVAGLNSAEITDSDGEDNRTATLDSLYGEARKACREITPLGYDGILRSEAGIEIIYCNFSDGGLEQVSTVREVPFKERLAQDDTARYQWMRAISQKYDGIGRDRVRIDFSSMVSGLFFPFNYSSPFPNWPERIRLLAAGPENVQSIKRYALDALRSRGRFTLNWQAVVEAIVDHFSARLAAISSPTISDEAFVKEIEGVTLMYLSAGSSKEKGQSDNTNRTTEAVQRCARLHLLPALASRRSWSLSDELIHTAVKTVMDTICDNYYQIYTNLLEIDPNRAGQDSCSHTPLMQGPHLGQVVTDSQKVMKRLMNKLNWADWRKIRPCPVDQVLFIAMQPWGSADDHWNPGCRPPEYFNPAPFGYW